MRKHRRKLQAGKAEHRGDKPCANSQRANRDSGSIAPGVCKYLVLLKTSNEGNRVVEPFINSSCPVREIRKRCPRGKEHNASEAALIFCFSHFKGLKYKSMFWGSLPCSPSGKVMKPVTLKLLLFLYRIFAAWPHDQSWSWNKYSP